MEKIAPVIALLVLKVLGIKFIIRKHTDYVPSPAVFIINHSSTLDVLTLLALGLPRVRFVAKWEFQYNPIFLILGRLTGQVFIRRDKTEKAIETLQKNVKRIKKKRLSLMMAPEGTRKHPGIIGPFKKGPFRMAHDLDYPLVPIFFEGNHELSSGDYLVARSGTCIAHIHPAYDTSGWEVETLDKHIEEVRGKYLMWSDRQESVEK